jgi:hypothetical protein
MKRIIISFLFGYNIYPLFAQPVPDPLTYLYIETPDTTTLFVNRQEYHYIDNRFYCSKSKKKHKIPCFDGFHHKIHSSCNVIELIKNKDTMTVVIFNLNTIANYYLYIEEFMPQSKICLENELSILKTEKNRKKQTILIEGEVCNNLTLPLKYAITTQADRTKQSIPKKRRKCVLFRKKE